MGKLDIKTDKDDERLNFDGERSIGSQTYAEEIKKWTRWKRGEMGKERERERGNQAASQRKVVNNRMETQSWKINKFRRE